MRQRGTRPGPEQARRELVEAGQQPRLGQWPETAPGDLVEASVVAQRLRQHQFCGRHDLSHRLWGGAGRSIRASSLTRLSASGSGGSSSSSAPPTASSSPIARRQSGHSARWVAAQQRDRLGQRARCTRALGETRLYYLAIIGIFVLIGLGQLVLSRRSGRGTRIAAYGLLLLDMAVLTVAPVVPNPIALQGWPMQLRLGNFDFF